MKFQSFVVFNFPSSKLRSKDSTFLVLQIAFMMCYYTNTKRAPTFTFRLRPFGPALGPSGLLDNILHALRALRPCDPHNQNFI